MCLDKGLCIKFRAKGDEILFTKPLPSTQSVECSVLIIVVTEHTIMIYNKQKYKFCVLGQQLWQI